jgi:lipopolysaccharide transport system ATP-binding protein
MSQKIVTVEDIGKVYRIGARYLRADTLGEVVVKALRAPFGKVKELQGISPNAGTAFWALKNVSFDIEQGEVLGIVGRNGAGKSTLLKILSKITTPTEGRAVIKGRISSLLEVGTGFHQDLTGRENIYLNGAILGMARKEINRKFDEIVDFAEIGKFLDTPVKRYSSGMYVRLAFAVAAHLEPEILIVDEVLAVGDIQFQKKCLGKMENVSKTGRTILFVSHNMGAIRHLCTKGVWLKDGRCMLVGKAAEVVDAYMSDCSGNGNTGGIKDRKRLHVGLPDAMRITNVEIENPRLVARNEGATLDELLIRIDYELLSEVKYFTAEWWIRDSYGVTLAYSNATHTANTVFYTENGERQGRVVCRIPQFPLTVGEYVIDVGLGIPGIRHFDLLQDVCRLNITMSDPAGTGYTFKKEVAPFFINCSWEKNPGSQTCLSPTK